MLNEIAILDFGGQYTHLIARRIRNLGVYSEIYHPESFQITHSIKGIIFSGGPQSVQAKDAYRIDFSIKDSPVPLLGICYGHQLIAHIIGGKISTGSRREYGNTEINLLKPGRLLNDTAGKQKVWMSHGDHVESLPAGYHITAATENIPVAAFESADSRIMGVQFHPEVSHTQYGNKILDNFLSLCIAQRDWNPHNYKEQLISEVKKAAGNKDLLILLSGGVDSLVAMELCLAALGKNRVFAIHIDTGFMRYEESANIIRHLREFGYQNLKLINAQDIYLKELQGVTDPEAKRLIIGRLFVEIAGKALADFKNRDILLVQGTIYPDTIESGESQKSAKIKTHHNRVSEIEKLIQENKIIEPIKDLYKDEVRLLGLELNIPSQLVNRHPFPGPGLAIRILASSQEGSAGELLPETEKLNKLLAEPKLNALILPVRSVGVMGDFRTYHHPVLFSCKNIADHNWQHLRQAARKAINGLESVNRALFYVKEITPDIRLKQHYLTKEACDHLREVDHLLMQWLKNIKDIWQMPVVQLPLFDQNNRQVYVMRPITSIDAMTADFYEMKLDLLQDLVTEIEKLPYVAALLYDITSKPPATIEWE